MPDKPRIAWFTPLARPSAISNFSLLVTRALASVVQIDLWVPQDSDFHLTALPVFVVSRDPLTSRARMMEYDLVIYNMGNHFPFHGEIYSYLECFPGIVILHDLVLHNFFCASLVAQCTRTDGYLTLIKQFYGGEARTQAELAFEGKVPSLWDADQILKYPLFEPAISNAFGVVTHSDWALERIRQVYEGPTERIYLAYDRSHQKPKQTIPRDSVRLLLLSVGAVNPNKRIAGVIHAIGLNPDIADIVEYVVVGSTGDDAYFNECLLLVQNYGLEECVRFVGHASDAVLYEYLERADICLNLRFPTTESGSATLAEGMLAGKPILAFNVGCFCDIPDDCIVRIDVANEQVELPHALRRLIADSGARTTLGQRARCFADQNFTAQAYVGKLLPFFDRVRSGAPLMRSLNRIGEALKQVGAMPEMLIYRTVAETFHELFCKDDPFLSSHPQVGRHFARKDGCDPVLPRAIDADL